jgi:arylsulfatase A-like enzyme
MNIDTPFNKLKKSLSSHIIKGLSLGAVATSLLVFIPDISQAQEKPNIVLFYVDDMGWKDVGYNGNPYAQTPNIDLLASEGMVFTNAYANAPNCAPSRACLISGQYTPRHGVYTVGSSDQGATEDKRLVPTPNTAHLTESHITFGDALQAAGYVTGTFGKWHVGDDPTTQGFDVNIAGGTEGNPGSDGYFSPYNDLNNLSNGPTGEYLTDRLTDEVISFIEDNKENPFFVYLPHYAVHTPIQGKQDKVDKYGALYPTLSNSWIKYLAMIESIDESVGKIRSRLNQLGLEENTVFVFTSDNGAIPSYTSLAPLRGTKGMFYEGGIRIPFIVKWPGHVEAGSSCDVPIIGTDLYPTFLEMADADVPSGYTLDGESIMPLLTQSGTLTRETIFLHSPIYLNRAYGIPEKFRTTPSSALRKGPWKLIEFFETGNIELYNLVDDIGEKNDLAEFLPDTVAMLYKILENWRDSINAPVPTQKNSGFEPLFRYTSFPEEGELVDAGGNASVTVQLRGECLNTEMDSIIIRIYHKAALYDEMVQKMNFSGGKAPFSFSPELGGSDEKYKFKVYFIRNIIEEVDTIVRDVGVTNFTGIYNTGMGDHAVKIRTLQCRGGKSIALDITNEKRGVISIALLNSKGRLIFSKPVVNEPSLRVNIDVSDKSQGVYFLRLKVDGRVQVRKMVLAR